MGRSFKLWVAKFISTFFYVGLIPKAPGTFGTLAAVIVIAPFLQNLSFYDMQYLLCGSTLIGLITTKIYMHHTKKSDPKEVVIDEVVGVWLCIFVNMYYMPHINMYINLGLSFVFFRFFDILKPFPISYVDKKMDNALGVMLDDVLAGIIAIFPCLAIMYFL